MAIGIMEVRFVVGAILLIVGIYLLMTKKQSKIKLLSGVSIAVLGLIFLVLATITYSVLLNMKI